VRDLAGIKEREVFRGKGWVQGDVLAKENRKFYFGFFAGKRNGE